MSRVLIPEMTLCEQCMFAERCSHRSNHVVRCHRFSVDEVAVSIKKMIATGEYYFRPNKKLIAEHREEVLESFNSIRDGLKKVRPEQVSLVSFREIKFSALPKEERIRNSRDGSCEKVGDTFDFKKYCQQCGDEFLTVNRDRRLCDACHDEICEVLGCDYSFIVRHEKQKEGEVEI